jgi:hypothetical protein
MLNTLENWILRWNGWVSCHIIIVGVSSVHTDTYGVSQDETEYHSLLITLWYIFLSPH